MVAAAVKLNVHSSPLKCSHPQSALWSSPAPCYFPVRLFSSPAACVSTWLPAAVTGFPWRSIPSNIHLLAVERWSRWFYSTPPTAASKACIFTFPWFPVSLGGSSLSHSSFSTQYSSKNYHLSVSGHSFSPISHKVTSANPSSASFFLFLFYLKNF